MFAFRFSDVYSFSLEGKHSKFIRSNLDNDVFAVAKCLCHLKEHSYIEVYVRIFSEQRRIHKRTVLLSVLQFSSQLLW